ncbi:hypothetical protein NQ314_005224 [Rhamnusium bicolor]|uniref:Cyclic AMP-dependent transcription factor ATF-2 n=1 Tax=Rhamnusium bicolor TaxID=1586634 RepID=A0AAV8ZJ80_9CUCU|nr:hypothetical protein NQ314_005224 [Rhamnusium bicolor]
MNETQKPFACSEKGCEMTFTNEDHLNWHQKKHDMMLNLGLSKNNDIADQTPTPTRFIRNCEEVGLFQDLQNVCNVNPFDEYFKKAVDLAKNGVTLDIPETNSDDTLHTPHILPHIEENRQKINNANNRDDNTSQSNDFSLNNVIPIAATSEHACENDNSIIECKSTPVIVIDDDSNNEKQENNIKKKIKEALQNKDKQKENQTSTVSTNSITVVPFHNLATIKQKPNNIMEKEKSNNINSKICSNSDDNSKEKIREMNRAAQIRCRKRKQMRWREMELEIRILKEENKKFKMENNNLKFQLMQIKEKSLNADKGMAIASSNIRNSPILPRIQPQKSPPAIPNPIVIQILPSASNLDVVVSQNPQTNIKIENIQNLTNLNDESEQKKVKKKNLRKIVPKIIMEN